MILEQPFVERHIPVGQTEHLAIEFAVVRDDDEMWWVLRDVKGCQHAMRPRVLPTYFAYAANFLHIEMCLLRRSARPSRLVHCSYALAAAGAPPVRWSLRRMPQAEDGTPLEGLVGVELDRDEASRLSAALRLSAAPSRAPLQS